METLIALIGPLHPPLVHFAVACPILAFFAIAAQKVFRKEWLGEAAAALWSFAFLAALAAGISGHLFSLHLGFETRFSIIPPESAAQGRLRDHVWLGSFASLFAALTLWAAVRTFRDKPLPWNIQFILGLMTAVLAGLTGHEGGEMVYGSENTAPPALISKQADSAGQIHENTNPAATTEVSLTPKTLDLLSLARGYRTHLVKMNTRPWNSRTHGHRWVNTYVSKEGMEAYQKSDVMPEGSRVVKESFEDADGKPSGQPGPLYIMVKGPTSSSPRTGGWQYALSWDNPVPGNPEKIQMPVQWLPGNPHLNSCAKCHNHFKLGDYLGGIPEGFEKK